MHDSNLYCKKLAVEVEQCIIHFVLLQQLLYYSLSQLGQHNLKKQNDPQNTVTVFCHNVSAVSFPKSMQENKTSSAACHSVFMPKLIILLVNMKHKITSDLYLVSLNYNPQRYLNNILHSVCSVHNILTLHWYFSLSIIQ